MFADRRGPRTGRELVEEKNSKPCERFYKQNQERQEDEKKNKRNPGSGVPSSKSNIARAIRDRISKVPNFSAIMNHHVETNVDLTDELIISTTNAPPTALKQVPPITINTTTDPAAERDETQPVTVLKKYPQTL